MKNYATKSRIADLGDAIKSVGDDLSKLTDDQVMTLVTLRRRENVGKKFITIPEKVDKLALQQGEELWDFVSALSSAVMENRVTLADGSLDIWLTGIFDDAVVVQDFTTGKMFKSTFVRNADGTFEFGEPVEVRAAFIEVATGEVDDGEEATKAITKAVKKTLTEKTVPLEVGKKGLTRKWSGVLWS